MNDLDRLQDAFLKADAAGNKEDAKLFADEIRRLQQFDSTQEQTQGQPTNLSGGGDGNFQGSSVGGVIQGWRDPIDAAAHFIPKVGEAAMDVGQYATSLGGSSPNVVSNTLGDASKWFTGQAQDVYNLNQKNNQIYEQKRADAGRTGMDVSRLVGNATSPAYIPAARLMPLKAGGIGSMAAQGLKLGAVGGALQPVNNNENYWSEFGKNVGSGGAGGAVLTPIIGKIGQGIGRQLQKFGKTQFDEKAVDKAVDTYLAKSFQKREDLNPYQLEGVKNYVKDALKKHKTTNIEEVLRTQDFKKLGTKPTLGQRTRDPMQFARERNLRGVEGVGEPLQVRFTQQGEAVRKTLAKFGGDNADELNRSSIRLAEALKKQDNTLKANVTDLYNKAKTSAGKDLDVPLTGLSQDYAQIKKDYRGVLPAGVLDRFEELGLSTGKRTKVFTVDDAENILKLINKHYTGNNKPLDSGLSELSRALKKAVSDAAPEGSVFAPAVKAARQRFLLHENMPALEAAFKGNITPDKFVKKYIIDEADTKKLKLLVSMLKKHQPEVFDDIKAQVGKDLQRAAYGEDLTGSKGIAPERLAKAIRKWGTDKLESFYSKDEVDLLKTAARVAQDINVAPEGAAVSTSNSGNTLINLSKKLPVLGQAIQLGEDATKSLSKNRTVTKALAEQSLAKPTELSPRNKRILAAILGGGGIGAGASVAKEVK